jgi:hypothetical protein
MAELLADQLQPAGCLMAWLGTARRNAVAQASLQKTARDSRMFVRDAALVAALRR